MRWPLGCEYVYGRAGAVKGDSVGETSTAESCGLLKVEGVLPYTMGL